MYSRSIHNNKTNKNKNTKQTKKNQETRFPKTELTAKQQTSNRMKSKESLAGREGQWVRLYEKNGGTKLARVLMGEERGVLELMPHLRDGYELVRVTFFFFSLSSLSLPLTLSFCLYMYLSCISL